MANEIVKLVDLTDIETAAQGNGKTKIALLKRAMSERPTQFVFDAKEIAVDEDTGEIFFGKGAPVSLDDADPNVLYVTATQEMLNGNPAFKLKSPKKVFRQATKSERKRNAAE